jgi:cytochrome oxidase Cu insertion factor (SCO1/SenC/PrrC family)
MVLAIALFSSKRWIFPSQAEELPVFGVVPDFSLTDQDGRPVSLEDLRGKAWIADFIFTRCLGPCPVMTNMMSDLQDEIPRDVTFVSFTLDPGYDTPETLREYAAANGADTGRWIFLTGDHKVIYNIPNTLKLLAEAYVDTIIHSTRYLLVDGQAQVRGWYPVVSVDLEQDEAEIARMKEDVEALLRSREG